METLSVLWGNAGRPLADGPGCDGEVGAGGEGGERQVVTQWQSRTLTLCYSSTHCGEKQRLVPRPWPHMLRVALCKKSTVESKVGSPMWPGLIIHACFAQYQQVDMLTTGHGPQVVQVTCRLLCTNYMCTVSILNLVSLFWFPHDVSLPF